MHLKPDYGVASLQYGKVVARILRACKADSLTDYGAGKCRLKTVLDPIVSRHFEYLPYDPAFPEYGEAQYADLVCCIDVLEHVETDYVDNVIQEIADITRGYVFLTIHTGPAYKRLSDGRNAHITQQPSSWWLARLCVHFDVMHLQITHEGFWILAVPAGNFQAELKTIRPREMRKISLAAWPERPPFLRRASGAIVRWVRRSKISSV